MSFIVLTLLFPQKTKRIIFFNFDQVMFLFAVCHLHNRDGAPCMIKSLKGLQEDEYKHWSKERGDWLGGRTSTAWCCKNFIWNFTFTVQLISRRIINIHLEQLINTKNKHLAHLYHSLPFKCVNWKWFYLKGWLFSLYVATVSTDPFAIWSFVIVWTNKQSVDREGPLLQRHFYGNI